MTATTASPPRIATLDIVRGVAVMGILAMNIVAFAMPMQAYLNPLAFAADSAMNIGVWVFNFIVVDGKTRGLFSFLFGASMLLVAQRAEARNVAAKTVIVPRQLWLLFFGMIHYYLIWWGDILIGYALIGLAAFLFRGLSARRLVGWGIAFLLLQLLVMAMSAGYASSLAVAIADGSADAAAIESWTELARGIATPSADAVRQEIALHLGPWTGVIQDRLAQHAVDPFFFVLVMGWETLAYMLFGMAALKSGFLTGAWADRVYWQVALIGLAIGIPAYALLASMLVADGFTVPGVFTWSFAATVPFRPAMILAYAALIILATRGGGCLVDRIAAAGRAAFTNYLATSILMTGLFYGWGLGLYGTLGRAELWLVVIGMWLVMLAWSKPWLDRFTYGPFEWAWRSLSRWQVQSMRRVPSPAVRESESAA